jgi:small GTP-binding protein
VKLGLLGESGVGKSAITLRIFNKEFRPEYDPSCEDVYGTKVQVDDKELPYIFYDPKGQEASVLMDYFLCEADGFLLIYSITSRESFDVIKKIYETIPEEERFKVILIGNKSDLAQERKVTYEEGKALADALRIPFYESSAKNDENITQAFADVGKIYRKILASLQEKVVEPVEAQGIRLESQDGINKGKEIIVQVQDSASHTAKDYIVQVPDGSFEKAQVFTVQVKEGVSSKSQAYTVEMQDHSVKIKAQEGPSIKLQEGSNIIQDSVASKLQGDTVELDLADIKIQGVDERGNCCVAL